MGYEGYSEYYSKATLELLVGKTGFSTPTAYVALFVGDPLDGGSEVSGVDYAREATSGATWGSASFVSPTATITNAALIDFGTAGGAWGTVNYCAIYDAATAGNMLASGDLTVARPIVTGDPVTFPIGTLTIRYTQATV